MSVSDGPMPETPFIVKQSGTMPVLTHVPAWVWQCEVCGWLGTGLNAESTARREAADHLWDDHGIAACDPNRLGPDPAPHRWKHVKGSDSTDQCERCGRYCGK